MRAAGKSGIIGNIHRAAALKRKNPLIDFEDSMNHPIIDRIYQADRMKKR